MQPIYDPTKTYEENCIKGPFGLFAKKPKQKLPEGTKTELLGYTLAIPFGIGAGTLPNAAFVEAAWRWGFKHCYL